MIILCNLKQLKYIGINLYCYYSIGFLLFVAEPPPEPEPEPGFPWWCILLIVLGGLIGAGGLVAAGLAAAAYFGGFGLLKGRIPQRITGETILSLIFPMVILAYSRVI